MNRKNTKKELITSKQIGVALFHAQKNDGKLFLAMLMSMIGMRLSEIIAMRWSDVNFENSSVLVHRGRFTRWIALPSVVRQELIYLNKVAHDRMGFILETQSGSQLSAPWLRKALDRLSASLDLPHFTLRAIFKRVLIVEQMNGEAMHLKPFGQPVQGTNYYLSRLIDENMQK